MIVTKGESLVTKPLLAVTGFLGVKIMASLPEMIRTSDAVWKNRTTVQNERPLRDALHRLEVGLVDIDSLKDQCTKDKIVRLNIEGFHYSNKLISEEILSYSQDHGMAIPDTLNILFTEIIVNKNIYGVQIE